MNWRLLTAINAAIALVTVSAVIFNVTRSRPEQSRSQGRQTASGSSSGVKQSESREQKVHIESVEDLGNARVDDLGAVPAAELTRLMGRAAPEQLAAMALKFNDAPMDARTFGGMAVFFQAWTQLDPSAALTGAFQIRDVAMKKLAATAVIGAASPSAAPQLIAQLTEHPDSDLANECKGDFIDGLVGNWAYLDPEAASKFVDGLSDNGDQNFNYSRDRIGYAWGTLDPKAALAWVAKQGDNESYYRGNLYDRVIRGWCVNNTPDAAAYVAQHPDEPGAEDAASTVATTMFENDIDGATHWINSLPSGTSRDSAERGIASLWAQKNPGAAAHWLATLPEEDQANLARIIASNWVNTSWPDASRWLTTLTGMVHDQAAAAAVNRENATPGESLAVAQSIKDDTMRDASIQQTIRNWAATDPQAAQIWVKGSSLSDEQKQQLLTAISEAQDAAATEATAERVITN